MEIYNFVLIEKKKQNAPVSLEIGCCCLVNKNTSLGILRLQVYIIVCVMMCLDPRKSSNGDCAID